MNSFLEKLRTHYKLDLDSPYSITINGKEHIFQCLIRGYGAINGIIIDEDYSKVEPVIEEIKKRGFGYSCFKIDDPTNMDGFEEVLDDWGKLDAGFIINGIEYPGNHIHPLAPSILDIIAYERKDGTWDVYIFEPAETIPELESKRVDEKYIFIKSINRPEELNVVVSEIESKYKKQIDDNTVCPFYSEENTRRTIDKIFSFLKANDCDHMFVRSTKKDTWILSIRKKDFPLAEKVIKSNID